MKRKKKADPRRIAMVISLLDCIDMAFGDLAPPPTAANRFDEFMSHRAAKKIRTKKRRAA